MCGNVFAASHSELIDQAYKIVFNRSVDSLGLSHYQGKMLKYETCLSEVYVSLLSSNEYISKNNISNRQQYVSSLYKTLLHRDCSDTELATWSNSEYGIQDIIRLMLSSDEFSTQNIKIENDILPCNWTLDDGGPYLSAFLSFVKNNAYIVPCTYNIKTNIKIENRNDLKVSAYFSKVILKADENNKKGPMIHGKNLKNFSFTNIVVDGNISNRRRLHNDYWNNLSLTTVGDRNTQSNMIFESCENCEFNGLETINAVGASGMIIWGKGCSIHNSSFKNNGYGLNISPNFGEWADGLTVVSGEGFKIYDNEFIDNSDVNLVVANMTNGYIKNNLVRNYSNWAFVGIGLAAFQNNANRNFTKCVVEDNIIECEKGFCGIGITVGEYFWFNKDYTGSVLARIYGGTVRNNTVKSARQCIATMGCERFVFLDNKMEDCGWWKIKSTGQITSYFDMTTGDSFYIYPYDTPITLNRLIPDQSNLDILTIFKAERMF